MQERKKRDDDVAVNLAVSKMTETLRMCFGVLVRYLDNIMHDLKKTEKNRKKERKETSSEVEGTGAQAATTPQQFATKELYI